MATTLYANPYDTGAKGWYFKSLADFERQYKKHLPVEEYEIDFIDGSAQASTLFEMMKVNQANLGDFFEQLDDFEDMPEHEQAALYYAVTNLGIDDLDRARKRVDDAIRVTKGDARAYAEEYIDAIGGVGELPKNVIEMYFDYEHFGRDAKIDLEEDDPAHDLSNEEYGLELVDDLGSSNVNAEFYFDMDAFARDLRLGGDVSEFEFNDSTWTTDYR